MSAADAAVLERACKQQVLAQSKGKPLKIIPEDVVKETNRQFMQPIDWIAEKHFTALMRLHGM